MHASRPAVTVGRDNLHVVSSGGIRRKALLIVGAAAASAAIGGAALGIGLQADLPDVHGLESYTPPLSTRVVARDGTVIASFGEQKRILLDHKDVPKLFEQALVAVEDAGFYEHGGIDLKGIARAAWHDLTTLSLQQGASTLTQQLARNLFLKPEKTARRKIQEILVAMEIERHYSKQEILHMYINQVYMGHGRYGLEAASQFYFGKHARELTLPEAALLAGLIQRPESLSPMRNLDRSIKRRNHVLDRMAEVGAISALESEEAKKATVVVNPHPEEADLAPYFVEEVRRWLQEKFGDEALYQEGLQVKSTLDPRLQAIANDALESGLRELDKRQGWRGRTGTVPPGSAPETFEPASWKRGIREGQVTDAVVVQTSPGKARVRVGRWHGTLDAEAIAWTGRTNPAAFLRPGDLVRVRVGALTGEGNAGVALEQEPRAEAALVALDPASGDVLALVGGFDFQRSEFDRVLQARRQAGSSFKPIVAAAALMLGASPAIHLLDEPTVFVEPGTFKTYQPENYGKHYYGEITLREAIERSANIATVKLLDRTGYTPVIDLGRRLGLTTPLQPFPSMALGAFEVSLLELTGAYGSFANQGVRVEPHFVDQVTTRDRAVLHATKPVVEQAVPATVAYQMNRLLEGVVTDGTGAAAASLGRPLAGKTGTTDDFTDAWFIGYAPDLVVGVWVGFDQKKSLGSRETGAQAALPIWQRFMEQSLAGKPVLDFPEPPGIVRVDIDRTTGLRLDAAAGCTSIVSEAFVEGTEPTQSCSKAEHTRLKFPYPFQRYPLAEDGSLVIPAEDLDRLLASETSVRLSGDVLETDSPEGPASLPVRREGTPTLDMPEDLVGKLEPATFTGADGRPARVVKLSTPSR